MGRVKALSLRERVRVKWIPVNLPDALEFWGSAF